MTGRPTFAGAPGSKGFTLVEMMITIVVAVVLVGIAMPNFRSFMRRNNVTAQTNNLLADIQYARSEAVTQRRLVSVCALAPAPAGGVGCVAGGSSNFDNGWLIYTSSTANSDYSAADTSAQILRTTDAPRTVSVRANTATVLTINARGSLADGADRTYTVCSKPTQGQADAGDNTSAIPGKQVLVASSGRTTTATLAATGTCQ